MKSIMTGMKKGALSLLLFSIFTSLLIPDVSARIQAAGEDGPTEATQPPMDWRITGPTGGDVRALVVDPNDPQRFYFGTLDGQVYTSTDGGQQWRLLVNLNRPKLFVDNIIVDPRNSQTIYVATHRHKEPGGFFKTTDGGLTWRESPELKAEALHSLTQSSANPDILLVGTNNGVFRSNDAGETWTQLPATDAVRPVNVESLAIDPRNADVIFAGTWYLPYKSTDGGQTWKVIKTGMIDDSDIFAIDIDPRDPNHVIASACSGIYDSRNSGENWRKVQGIPSQSRRTRAILQHPSLPGLVFAGTTEGFWRSTKGGRDGSWMRTTSGKLEINSIAIHPKNPQNVYIGTNNYGVMVSLDGGKTFAPSNGGYSGRFANFILPDREQPDRVYATTINTTTGGGFFFVSNDGGATWQPSMRNMPDRLIGYSILQDERDGNIIYLGTSLGLYRSLDRGASWAPAFTPKVEPPPKPKRSKRRRGASPANRATAASASTTAASQPDEMVKRAQETLNAAGYSVGTPDGVAGTRTVAVIRKFQGDKGIPITGKLDVATLSALGLAGGVQAPTSVPATTLSDSPATAAIFLTDPINALAHTYVERDGRTGLLAATNTGLYRTYDPTQGWEKISYGSGLDLRTTCISTNSQIPQTIWVGTATSGVLVSRDGGETWQQVTGIPANAPISAIEQDKQRSGYIYVGTKQTFFYSHDGGQKWARRGGNLPYGDYASILINPRNSDEIIVGNAYQNNVGGSPTENSGGVYRSTDAGLTWARIDPRDQHLPSQRIWALAFDPRDQNRLFVGSHSAGIYVAARGADASLTADK